jgi:hypothetical protein
MERVKEIESRRVKKLNRADFQPVLGRGFWTLMAVQALTGNDVQI